MSADTYTCAHCAGVFEKSWSDEEAQAEADDLFGDDLGENPAVVCDDCFKAMTSELPVAVWREGETDGH